MDQCLEKYSIDGLYYIITCNIDLTPSNIIFIHKYMFEGVDFTRGCFHDDEKKSLCAKT